MGWCSVRTAKDQVIHNATQLVSLEHIALWRSDYQQLVSIDDARIASREVTADTLVHGRHRTIGAAVEAFRAKLDEIVGRSMTESEGAT